MVSMSSTPSAAKYEKSTPSLLKKRTADQAGLDHAIADALGKKKTGDMQSGDGKGTSTTPDPAGKSSGEEGKEVNAKDWLMDQVAKMESAFKVCRKATSRNTLILPTDFLSPLSGRLLLPSPDYSLSRRGSIPVSTRRTFHMHSTA